MVKVLAYLIASMIVELLDRGVLDIKDEEIDGFSGIFLDRLEYGFMFEKSDGVCEYM